MTTQQNLAEAFAGESQANRKYLAYAAQAEQDGFPQVARLFRAVAAAETVHAHGHLRAMDGVAGTIENLEDAMAGEKYEFTDMYPGFIDVAREEGHRRAERSMSHANAVEKVHYELFGHALEAVRSGEDLPELSIHVCPVCGHTVVGAIPDRCPVCNAKGEKYDRVA
jgi:rubrerythrin